MSDSFDLASQKDKAVQCYALNTYNYDEKGFSTGLSRSVGRIVSRKTLESWHLLNASHNSSQDFITLVASICTDRMHILPALIYQSKSRDSQDS